MFEIVKPNRQRTRHRLGVTLSKPMSKSKSQRTIYVAPSLSAAVGFTKEDRAIVEFDKDTKTFRLKKGDGEFSRKVTFHQDEKSPRISISCPNDISSLLPNKTSEYKAEVKDGALYFSV